jgi:hypothetical protein
MFTMDDIKAHLMGKRPEIADVVVGLIQPGHALVSVYIKRGAIAWAQCVYEADLREIQPVNIEFSVVLDLEVEHADG